MDRFRRLPLLRLALLPLTAGYLVGLHSTGTTATGADWLIGLGAAALCQLAGRFPLGVVLALSGLVVVADEVGQASPIGVKVLATVMLVELAARRWGRETWLGAAGLTATYAVVLPEPLPEGLGGLAYRLVIVVAAPVLLGAYLRSVWEAAVAARRRAIEEQQRREALVTEARRQQRVAIARELHDLVAHHLSSMVMRVGVVQHVVPDVDPRVGAVLEDVHGGASTALADLRRLLGVLREEDSAVEPGVALVEPEALPGALRAVVDQARADGLDVRAELSTDGLGEPDALRSLAVLRLVQEGLANAIRHGGPEPSAQVEIGPVTEGLRVRVTNPMAEPAPPAADPGMGLVGLRERVELVGGTFAAGPTTEGWELAAVLPADDREGVEP